MKRTCIKCGREFEPIERWKDKQKVCALCALDAIENLYVESVFEMSDEEIEKELRNEGVDVEAFKARVDKIVNEAMTKRKTGGCR